MELAWIRNCSSSAVGNLIFNEGAAEQEDLQFLWKRHDLNDFLNFNILILNLITNYNLFVFGIKIRHIYIFFPYEKYINIAHIFMFLLFIRLSCVCARALQPQWLRGLSFVFLFFYFGVFSGERSSPLQLKGMN